MELSTVVIDRMNEQSVEELRLGMWFWIHDEQDEQDEQHEPWLGCVVALGSNYAELGDIHGQTVRILLREFDKICRPEPNWKQVVKDNVHAQQAVISRCLAEIQALTTQLGVGRRALSHDSTGHDLVVLGQQGQQDNVAHYRTDLTTAKERTLPDLQKAVEKASTELGLWLAAETLPLGAIADEARLALKQVDNRLYAIGLYAGLSEQIVQIRQGKPAEINERLRIVQRRLYMDEECVAAYRAGGIECRTIKSFDRWLSKTSNFQRILPFPRCLVAFRVRREAKQREWDGRINSLFVNFDLAEGDKYTFLYIRNGAQLFRLNTDINFGSKLFPDHGEFDTNSRLWARVFCGRVDELIPEGLYQELVAEYKEKYQKRKEWLEQHENESCFRCPYHLPYRNPDEFQPFDPDSVYYDDICEELSGRVQAYNRIAVIVQGLLDRSTVLCPHPPISLWKPDSFASAVELIYDACSLHTGDVPDFEAYRERCNRSLCAGAVTVGQEDYWERKEAERENAQRARNWRYRSEHRPTRVRPYGNPGPGFLARVNVWHPKVCQAIYRWQRERLVLRRFSEDLIGCALTVPAAELLNVDAYRPGDFQQFYADYRTRRDYLRWANLLLAAEEYHAGNLRPSSI
jgi:hypothetical protein